MSPEEGGEPFGSRYLLFEVVGRGATGRVFRARVRGSGDEVAVKVLRDELAADEEVVARCLRERQVLASVTHPNVVRVRDLVVEGDRLGIVTDFVAGGDLRRAVPRPCPPASALDLMAQVGDGLAAVHAAGVVHRDVKPENVLVEAGAGGARAVRLTDFGIARLVGSTMTRLSTIAGTPLYMSPEVAGGDRATGAADMYAVGVMLYELYTGRPPFAAENPLALMRAHVEDPVPRPAGISGEVWALLDVLLAKDPSSRPTAAATAIRLRDLDGAAPGRAAGDDDPTGDRPVTHTTLLRHRRAVPDPGASPPPAPARPGRRRPLAFAVAAAVLALAAVTGGALAARRGSAPAGDALSTQGSEPTTAPGQELIGTEPTTTAAPADPLAPAPGTAPAAGPVAPAGASPVPPSTAPGAGGGPAAATTTRDASADAAAAAARAAAGIVAARAARTRLDPGDTLAPGERIQSPNGRYVLTMQTDGNLVLLAPGNRPVWFTGTGERSSVLTMQPDGNAVVRAPGNRPVWFTGTDAFPGSALVLQDDGNLVVVAPGNRPVWATNTMGA